MNGYLTDKGIYYEIPAAINHHCKFLTDVLKLSGEDLYYAVENWVIIRWWKCDNDMVKPFFKYRSKTNAFTYTERKKYTLAQLEWLKLHNCFIDKNKI